MSWQYTTVAKMPSIRKPLLHQPHVPSNLEHLDLAGAIEKKKHLLSQAEPITKGLPSLFGNLGLMSHPETLGVENGEKKMFNRAYLLSLGSCGEFVLFPNLPRCLRLMVYEECWALEPRIFRMIEVADQSGVRSVVVSGDAHRPAILKASKEALAFAIVPRQYAPVFRTTDDYSRNYYFNSRIDFLELCHSFHYAYLIPTMTISQKLVRADDLHHIKSLSLDFETLLRFSDWTDSNLSTMPKLQSIHIRSICVDRGRFNQSAIQLELRELSGRHNGLTPFLRDSVPGPAVVGRSALVKFSTYVVDIQLRKHFKKFILHKVQEWSKSIPQFPPEVILHIHLMPCPNYPFAPVQPPIQHWAIESTRVGYWNN